MIKQNDKNCMKVVQDIGCFVRTCGLVAEYKVDACLTASQINSLWIWGKENYYINQDNNVVNSEALINRALTMLGGKGRFIEVGTFVGGKTNYYPAIPPKYRHIDACIQKIAQGGPSGTHFRLVDKDGGLIEDPYEPPIKPLGIFYSILYAYEE